MASRSWRWLRWRIEGLLTRPITLDATGNPAFANRLQVRFADRLIDTSAPRQEGSR